MNASQSLQENDAVNAPKWYTQFGVECVEFSRWMHCAQAQAFQYVWRCGDKHDSERQDLEKALWWLRDWVAHSTCASIYPDIPQPATNAKDGLTPEFDPGYHALRTVAEHFDFCLGSALIAIRDRRPTDAIDCIERYITLKLPAAPAAGDKEVPAGGNGGRQRRKP